MSDNGLCDIRVDHTGALRAPKRLREAAEENRQGALPTAALDRLRDEVIEELIRKQEEIGLPVVTDGEMRRKNFQDSFNAAVEGFEGIDNRPGGENISARPFTRTEPLGQWRWPMSKRLRFVRNVALEEFKFSNKIARPGEGRFTWTGSRRFDCRIRALAHRAR